MKTNKLAELMRNNKPAIGSFMNLFDPGVAIIFADSGIDWIFVDGEHNPFTDRDVLGIVNALRDKECAVIFRVRENIQANIKFALDMGVQGVIVPMLNSAEEVKKAVEYAKYPPLGKRGYSPIRVTDFWTYGAEYNKYANEITMIIVQIESPSAVDDITEIVKIEGLNGLFIGPADLSCAMGYLGNSNHPEVQAKIDRVIDAANCAGIPWGIPAGTNEDLEFRVKQGGKLMLMNSDTRMIKSTATEVAKCAHDIFKKYAL
jgi:2-keto-3-deoxy-L-rhamnonate aldolase RhmA